MGMAAARWRLGLCSVHEYFEGLLLLKSNHSKTNIQVTLARKAKLTQPLLVPELARCGQLRAGVCESMLARINAMNESQT